MSIINTTSQAALKTIGMREDYVSCLEAKDQHFDCLD
jgi:hypothetical protein